MQNNLIDTDNLETSSDLKDVSDLNDIAPAKVEFINKFYEIRGELLAFLKRKLANSHDAEDVIQELFVAIHNINEALVDRIEEPRFYIYRMANNLALKVLKKQVERNKLTGGEIDLDSIPASSGCPESVLEANQRVALLKSALASMPPKRRNIFLLYRFSKMSRQEIAKELDMSVESVHKNITRALKHCQDCIQQGEI